MVHEQPGRDEVRREEREREARLLRKVERNLNDVRLEFQKQSFRL
jgi:hypothetical protein